MKDLQYKSLRRIERKEDREDGVMHIRAYALVFGNVDSYGDIIGEKACDAFLSGEDAGRMRLCYQHDSSEVIGVITDKGVDAVGMWIEADILPTSKGTDVQTLLRAGAIDEFSIGYYADKYHYERREGYQHDLRILDAITVIEVSPVTRAANPKAVLTDMKNDNNPLKQVNMPTEDMKKVLDTIEQNKTAAEQMAAELEKKLTEKETDLKAAQASIDNLDASIKSQQQTIADLRKMIQEQPKTFEKAVRDALETKREEIGTFLKKSSGNMNVQFKLATGSYSAQAGAQAFGNQVDSTIHAIPVLSNAFLLAFGTRAITASRLVWREANEATKVVGYVAELAENANKSEVTFIEKYRQFAKVATFMEISSEADMWFEELVNYCTQEGQRIILSDIDDKIWTGEGDETTKPKEIYGLKKYAPAFDALASYANATIADVVIDAVAQIRNAGYAANVAVVSYKAEQLLKTVKDNDGHYMYNEVTGMLGQVRIIPSAKVADTEILVADNSCVEVYLGSTYELEFSRKAETDSWRVDFRRLAQVKIPTPKLQGLRYIADYSAAVTAISA